MSYELLIEGFHSALRPGCLRRHEEQSLFYYDDPKRDIPGEIIAKTERVRTDFTTVDR
jgi:hypothetical protein